LGRSAGGLQDIAFKGVIMTDAAATTPAVLDAEMLIAERRRFFVATRGGVYFPISGAIFWLLLGVAGFHWSHRTWCVVVLSAAIAATPIAIVLFKKLVSRLALKSPLATLILPALLPVVFSLGIAFPAFYSDLSLVPLALVIGMASHWPAVGWLYETSIFAVHTVVRVLLAVAIWFLLPEGRFTWLPISTAVVYAVTSVWILREVRRLEEATSRAR
jgi:hypothetical protein